jgi:hypothetical protein
MTYLKEIERAIKKANRVKNKAIADELKKYKKEYKLKIKKLQSLIDAQPPGGPRKLNALFRQIEKEMLALSNKLSTSAQVLIRKSTRQAVLDVQASIRATGGRLKGNYTAGMSPAVFERVWKAAMDKVIRGVDGVTLSERIWEIHEGTYKTLRKMIADGYAEGLYPGEIQRNLRAFLYLPDVDMRKTYWKEYFKKYPPGRGVYRSAYKNTERVLRTEVTRAYRESTAEYAKAKAWVKGIKWHRTAGAEECDECDEYERSDMYGLGEGVYPPDGVPVSHPNCFCYLTIEPIEDALEFPE